MIKVYVAGPYSSENHLGVLDNMRNGMRAATQVLVAGYAPFCPWMDFHYQLMLGSYERLSVEDYYAYSMAWLEVSDVMLVIPGWEQSKGTNAELAKAKILGIPVVFSFAELLAKMPVKK